jgi:hypothetical protein
MLGVRADHTHHTLAVNHLALVANFPNGSPNFHVQYRLLVTIRDAPTVEIIGRQLNQNSITRKNSDEVLSHLSRDMREHLMLIVFKLDPKHCVRKSLEDLGHDFYRFFLRHTAIGAIPPLVANFGY